LLRDNNIIKRFLGSFFRGITLLLNKVLKAVLGVYVKLSIVLTAYNVLLLLLKATKEDKGFIWPGKRLFKTSYKKEV
jgi:hypothetical protein